ncbi:MAG: DUF4476 domain-containing protein [Cytophagales bacterium]
MRKALIILSLSMLTINVFAQFARLVVFTENGDRFFLYINGKLQNANLQSNVTTKKIAEDGVTMRVVFDREGLGERIFKLPVKSGYEVTCALVINKKNEYVIKYAGEAPIEVEAVNEVEAQPTTRKNQTSQQNNNNDDDNMDVNINIGLGEVGGNTTVQYTQKVKTTSSTTQNNNNLKEQEEIAEPKKAACDPMISTTFAEAKKSVAAKGFDETRITESKQILDANCMTAKQIKELLATYGFEESRLEIAKYAYQRCTDQNNYFLVNSAFSFETSVDELNRYIKSVK